jgi:hypothetical protein
MIDDILADVRKKIGREGAVLHVEVRAEGEKEIYKYTSYPTKEYFQKRLADRIRENGGEAMG